MVTYTLAGYSSDDSDSDGAWITLRASGTEPKLKYYLEASSAAVADRLVAAVEAELVQPQACGLTRPQH